MQWVQGSSRDRKQGAPSWEAADRLLDDAVLSAIALQQRAGLGLRHGWGMAPRKLCHVFADAVDGFLTDAHVEPGRNRHRASRIPRWFPN